MENFPIMVSIVYLQKKLHLQNVQKIQVNNTDIDKTCLKYPTKALLNKHEKQEPMEKVYKVEVEFKTVFNLVENKKK